jgi:DNA-binding ferritin-like protein (Dps family)
METQPNTIPPAEVSVAPEITPVRPSLEKLRNTLQARLQKISQETTTNDKGEATPTKKAKAASSLNILMQSGWGKFSLKEPAEIEIEYMDLSGKDKPPEEETKEAGEKPPTKKQIFSIKVENGKILIDGIVERDGAIRKPGENEALPNVSSAVIVESYLEKIFPNLSPQEYQALTSTILGQEPGQIEDLAHSLGYLTRGDLGEILGIPKDPEERAKFLGKPENKKYQQIAEKIYGSEGKPPEIAEIPEAQDIINVLEKAGIQPNKNLQQIVKNIKEHLKSRFGDKANEQPLMLLIAQLEKQIGENNKTLAEIITNHYSTIESGEIPEDNLGEFLPTIKQLYDVNGNINQQKAIELKDKLVSPAKNISIALGLILALLLWQGMRESKGK